MRKSKTFHPVVLIMGALLIIALVLAMLYILNNLEKRKENEIPLDAPAVGMKAKPDNKGWRPLFSGKTLKGWETTNFGPQGPVTIKDSSIILNFGDGATGITWNGEFPEINYEIALEAMRIDGNDFFCGLTFPVEDEHCTFIVGGWGGSLVGISSIDGKDASENFTSSTMQFENGRWYNIGLIVTSDKIRCFIDDEEVAQVDVKSHNFSTRSEVGLSRPLGIATWHTTAAIRNIKFREVQ